MTRMLNRLALVQRRTVMLGLAGLPFLARRAGAERIFELDWSDLLPEGSNALPQDLRGVISHGGAGLASQQPVSSGVRTDWNGKTVRMPGYMVPLDFSTEGVTSFILVPYVGACIHVPPPPSNQLVLVDTQTPYEFQGLFEPVVVTGLFGTAGNTTELAEIGYAMTADQVVPYTPKPPGAAKR